MTRFAIPALALLLESAPLTAAPKATPTPTPHARRLSGGFGRGAIGTPTATPVAGQSLADAVREARKRKESKATIAITNDTLVTDPSKGRLTTASPRVPPTPSPGGGALSPTAAASVAEAEAFWRERMRAAQSRVEELRERVRRFEQESKKLENDFYSWDDGQYRDGVIKPAWDRKREELETAKRDLEQAEKEVSDLPEKARKAGALPGWLRQ